MRNYLTFDNKDSLDFGVYINGQGTFRAPARSYNVLNIPGRNGDLLGFGSKLENVEITYRAFIYTNFDANIAALRSFLLSHVGYFKLTDSYHPDEYRLAYYKGPFVPDVVANNGAGSFDLTFVCKPQRFLNSGEEVTTLTPAGAEQHTYQGEIVNFSTLAGDKITSALADFHPIQDLHGYDNPWPAGGGKNKWKPIAGGTAEGTYNGITYTKNNDGSYSFSGTATQSTWINFGNITLPEGTWTASVTKTGSYTGKVPFGANNGAFRSYPNLTTYPRTVTSGSETTGTFSINFANGVAISGTLTLWIQIESGSSATAWTPYSNICPISGRTGLSVYRTGVNVWDEQWELGNINGSGANQNASDRIRSKNYIPVTPGATYYYYINSTYGIYAWGYDSSKTYVGRVPSNGLAISNNTVTIPSGVYYIRIVVQPGYGTTYNNDISINYPSTDTDYHAYQGTTYAVDWTSQAGTVYGGTVDVVTGVLTVTWVSVDLGTVDFDVWNRNANRDCFAAIFPIVNRTSSSDNVHALSSIFTPTNYDATWKPWNMSYAVRDGQVLFMTPHDLYADGTEFKTAMSGVQFVYKLATPLTYQLTAQEIEALSDNYMWSDVGQVTVTVTDAMTIENPTLFDAKPLLRVYGAGTLTLGGQTITISTADVYTDIDCEKMDCFKDTVSKNGNVSFSGYDFPVIPPGRNVITMDGVTQVDITPRWWAA